ncbi:MAG: 3-hydroxyacyl-ACP dehydratase FabZ [Gammaproteobacteria bacterium]|nr:3-hydroxyacyl-ACP dehydratase FabZ [Gammaproteobacteria bacterium]
MDIGEIMRFLPHRYPFLLIDRVLTCVPNAHLRAVKNVTFNEPFFLGHFPGRPVMPGVMILEVMAQATGILAMRSLEQLPSANSLYYFVGIDKSRFRQPVVPGDQLLVDITQKRYSRGVVKADAVARVDGKTVAEAALMGALRDTGTTDRHA